MAAQLPVLEVAKASPGEEVKAEAEVGSSAYPGPPETA